MEFGKVSDIESVNWALPSEDLASLGYLRGLPPSRCQWFLGAPTWGCKQWIGKIYPREATPDEFLKYYARAFNTIELNTTHYGIPSDDKVKSWVGSVTPGFKFCPKFPQEISHRPFGLADKFLLGKWQKALGFFGDHLGVSFIQLPPHFDYSQKTLLFQFLEAWPSELPLALELRHTSWFQEQQVLPGLAEYLRKKGIGLVILDVAGKRGVAHTTMSAPFVLLRFIGNDLHPTDYSRAKVWCQRMKSWAENGLQQCYFFAHQPDDIKGPEMTSFLAELYNREVGSGWANPLAVKGSLLNLPIEGLD